MGTSLVLKNHLPAKNNEDYRKFVTMRLENQLFGLPIDSVKDVLRTQKITKVPLSSPEVAGLINLRGRIVTVIEMRRKIGLSMRAKDEYKEIVVESGGELYSLIVDETNEVMELNKSDFEPVPGNLAQEWSRFASGVYRLENELMVVFDIDSLFRNEEE